MTNPYKDLDRRGIYKALQRRAGELMKPAGPRTPEERAGLAQDTAYLLLAVAFFVARSEHSAASPQKSIAHGTMGFAEAFAEDYEALKRDARWRTLSEASDLALGGGLYPHQQTTIIGGHAAYEAALNTDEGLAAALAVLEQEFQAKNRAR